MWKNADCCFGVDKEQPSRQHVADVKEAVRGLDIASEGVEEGKGVVDREDEDKGEGEEDGEGRDEGDDEDDSEGRQREGQP